jgi:hypothetical protein
MTVLSRSRVRDPYGKLPSLLLWISCLDRFCQSVTESRPQSAAFGREHRVHRFINYDFPLQTVIVS